MLGIINQLKKPKKKKKPVGVQDMRARLPNMKHIEKLIGMRLEDIPEINKQMTIARNRAIPPKRKKRNKKPVITNKLHNQNFFDD